MNTQNIYIDWANVKDDLPRDFHMHTFVMVVLVYERPKCKSNLFGDEMYSC